MRKIFQPHTTYANDDFAGQPIKTIITKTLLVILSHTEDIL